jgi:hypothetical protein
VRSASLCWHCGRTLDFDRFHAGFSNQGYMYCDRDSTIVIWSSYDPTYSALSESTHPWMLTVEAKQVVERSIIDCPCGGQFRFANLPRCPHCNGDLGDLASEAIYYVILDRHIDGDVTPVWKAPGRP